jgi:hypothetical protein
MGDVSILRTELARRILRHRVQTKFGAGKVDYGPLGLIAA